MKTQKQILAAALCVVCAIQLHAQGTAFTYQGRLNDGANAAQGIYDLRFVIYDAAVGGNAVTGVLTNAATVVSNGLFTVRLDFGPDASGFDGNARWLEIGVRPSGSSEALTILNPRQPIAATPYAIRAANFSGAITDNQLSSNIARLNASQTFIGPVQFANSSNTFSGTFTGNGAGVTNVNLTALNSGGAITVNSNLFTSYFSHGYAPVSVAADVNCDGHVDLVGIDIILTNNGVGQFLRAPSPLMGAYGNERDYFPPDSITAADVDGDGWIDIISAIHRQFGLCPEDSNDCLSISVKESVLVLYNDRNGQFTPGARQEVTRTTYPNGSWSVFNLVGPNRKVPVTTADVNGDGRVDLISGHSGPFWDHFGYVRGWVRFLSVLINDGNGGFVQASSPEVFPEHISRGHILSLTPADVNSDGRVDLITVSTNTLLVLTNDGNGRFTLASAPAAGVSPDALVMAEVNGDARVDFIGASSLTNKLLVLTNQGSGMFTLAASLDISVVPSHVSAADVNQDGYVDVISAGTDDDALSILTNDHSGGFALAASYNLKGTPYSLVPADVNADRRIDLVTSTGDGLEVLLNLPFRFLGDFTGNGSGLTGLNASSITGTVPNAALDNAWKIGGNSGTTASKHFIGTTDDQPLELKVSGQRALRLESASCFLYTMELDPYDCLLPFPSSQLAANIIAGSSVNSVDAGVMGGTIGGGGGDEFVRASDGLYRADSAPNRVFAHFGTVSGGLGNTSGYAATVSGGRGNTSSGFGSAISGGSNNTSSNAYAVVTGGSGNTAGGAYSFAAGRRAQALHDGAFVWGDATEADIASTATNEFTVRATGGVRFITALDTNGRPFTGVTLAAGDGAWAALSDRNAKQNFEPANAREILDKVSALPLTTWNYKSQPESVRHIGPVAQDFHAAFGVGENDRTISTIDADGVALAAIQGLNEKLEEKMARVHALEKELAALKELFVKLSTTKE